MVCPIYMYEDLRLRIIPVREAVLLNPDFEGFSDIQKLCFTNTHYENLPMKYTESFEL